MTFEAQIVLRRDNPQQLADDVRAVSEFLEQRQRPARNGLPEGTTQRHLRAVSREATHA